MKKFFSNQTGSSLVQVMVISGMVSVFGLAVMQTSKNMQSMKKTLLIKNSMDQFHETINNLLTNEATCKNTLGTLLPQRSAAEDDVELNSILDFDANPAYTKFNPSSAATAAATTYHGNIRIGAIEYTEYNAAKDGAVLRFTLLKSDSTGPAKFGLGTLGAKQIEIDVPIRIFFTIPEGASGPVPSDVFGGCFADNGVEADGDSPLKVLCDQDLGGSFYNGRCIVAENIIDQTRCRGSYGTCSGDPANADASNSMCHNLGGVYNSVTKDCDPRFKNVDCGPGKMLKGFDGDGNLICEVP